MGGIIIKATKPTRQKGKTTMKKKLLCILLCALLLTVSVLHAVASASLSDPQNASGESVLSADLISKMDTASATELIPVSIWIEEIDTDIVERVALAKTGLNRETIHAMVENGKADEITMDDVNAYLAAERSVYAQLQKAASESFLYPKNITTSEMLIPLERETYVCSYAPMILTELTVSEIQAIALQTEVNTIYYAPNNKIYNNISNEVAINDTTISSMSVSTAFEQVRADYVRDTLGYKGQGVKIGVIEPGVPNEDMSCFANASITSTPVDPDFLPYIDNDHTTRVVSLLVSQDPDCLGLVPQAEVYCTPLVEDYNLIFGVEWFIDENVSVVNMSAHSFDYLGTYNPTARWIDHIAIQHSVHFVAIAGNQHNRLNPDLEITNPGTAYNAITVGASNMTLTDRASFSCYIEESLYADKPDILAPGENFVFEFDNTETIDWGTSYAAPIVTGIIAQILSACPSLVTYQDAMKAILTANIHNSTLRYTTEYSDADDYDQCGAGLVDARSAIGAARSGHFLSRAFAANTPINSYSSHSFTVSASDDLIRVSLTWLKYAYTVGDCPIDVTGEGTLANLDMEIIDPTGNCVASVWNIPGNVEIVDFVPTIPGTYTVRVYLTGSSTNTVYYALSWW